MCDKIFPIVTLRNPVKVRSDQGADNYWQKAQVEYHVTVAPSAQSKLIHHHRDVLFTSILMDHHRIFKQNSASGELTRYRCVCQPGACLKSLKVRGRQAFPFLQISASCLENSCVLSPAAPLNPAVAHTAQVLENSTVHSSENIAIKACVCMNSYINIETNKNRFNVIDLVFHRGPQTKFRDLLFQQAPYVQILC